MAAENAMVNSSLNLNLQKTSVAYTQPKSSSVTNHVDGVQKVYTVLMIAA